MKQKGRPLASMVQLKWSNVEVGAEATCKAHALIIATARLNKDPNYTSYRKGYKIRPVFNRLIVTTGIYLKNGAGISEISKFQEHFHEYKVVVYTGLNSESIMHHGHLNFDKRINLLFDQVTQHYQVMA